MNLLSTRSQRPESAMLAIVDEQPDEYFNLRDAYFQSDIHWLFATNGRQALRLAHLHSIDLWMINDHLPDMSGLDLCDMIKSRSVQMAIYVVTDEYNQANEQEARIRGAAMFCCKPVQPVWLRHIINCVLKRKKHLSKMRVPVAGNCMSAPGFT
jgi:DNA-binding response OmpR family regulator